MKQPTMDITPRLWTKQFITLSLASFLLFINLQMLLSSFSMHIKGNLDAGDIYVSLSTSVFAATAIVARLLTAKWLKQWSKEIILTFGLIIAAVSTALYILPGTIAPLLLLRALYGLGFGIGSTIIPTLVSQIIPAKRMGEGIGYFGLSTSLAMSVGPAAGLSIMKNFNFTTLALIGAVIIVLIFPLLISSKAYSFGAASFKRQTQSEVSTKQWNKMLVFPIYFPAILNILLSITYSGILSFIAVYGDQLQLSQVGIFFLFNALTILLVRPIAGKIFDKKGPVIVLIPAACFVVISMLVLSYTTSMGVLIASALLYGIGFGSIQPTLQAWMLKAADRKDHGTVNSMFYNATDIGVSLGAIILGVIATASSYAVMYRLSSLTMVIFIVAIVLYLLLKERKVEQYSQQISDSATATNEIN